MNEKNYSKIFHIRFEEILKKWHVGKSVNHLLIAGLQYIPNKKVKWLQVLELYLESVYMSGLSGRFIYFEMH